MPLNNEFKRPINRKTMEFLQARKIARYSDPEEQMSAIVIRNLSPETHRALQARATRHGRSTEAEARMILDDAVRPKARVKLGSALAAFERSLGGLDLDIFAGPDPGELIDLR